MARIRTIKPELWTDSRPHRNRAQRPIRITPFLWTSPWFIRMGIEARCEYLRRLSTGDVPDRPHACWRVAKTPKATISKELRTKVFERDDNRCRQCGTTGDLTADHIHPESKGGPTILENLQTLCRSCNSKKGAR